MINLRKNHKNLKFYNFIKNLKINKNMINLLLFT